MDAAILLVGGVGVGLLGMTVGLVLRTYVKVRRDASRICEGEVIFPLGYCLVIGNTPSERYRQRLDLARVVWERGGIPIWCLAGSLANMEYTIAHHSKRYLVARGVVADAVRTIEEFPFLGRSVETIQEVLASRELARRMNIRRLIVISDVLHLAQIHLVLRSLDIAPIFVSTPLMPSWTADDIRYLVVRVGALILTLADRRGRTLGWLRMWRSGEFRKVSRLLQP